MGLRSIIKQMWLESIKERLGIKVYCEDCEHYDEDKGICWHHTKEREVVVEDSWLRRVCKTEYDYAYAKDKNADNQCLWFENEKPREQGFVCTG